MFGPGGEQQGQEKQCTNDQVMPLLAHCIDGGYKDNSQEDVEQYTYPEKVIEERVEYQKAQNGDQ